MPWPGSQAVLLIKSTQLYLPQSSHQDPISDDMKCSPQTVSQISLPRTSLDAPGLTPQRRDPRDNNGFTTDSINLVSNNRLDNHPIWAHCLYWFNESLLQEKNQWSATKSSKVMVSLIAKRKTVMHPLLTCCGYYSFPLSTRDITVTYKATNIS